MSCREEFDRVLATELERWATKPWTQIVSELRTNNGNLAYQIVRDSHTYEVEVELVETHETLDVVIIVDDGKQPEIPASIASLLDFRGR